MLQFRKSESNVTCCNSSPLTRLTKSGSFSGCGNPGMNNDRHTSSDPSAIHFACYGNYETSTTSGADSDEDRMRRQVSITIKTCAGHFNLLTCRILNRSIKIYIKKLTPNKIGKKTTH